MKFLKDSKISNSVWILSGFMLIGLLSISTVCLSAEFTWTQKTDMPTPRWAHSSAVVNGKIYAIGGGSSQPGSALLPTVEEYDPATDTWTTKADMPTARGWISPSSAEVNGKIYVIGGDGGRSVVEEYDPATDAWTRKADMPTGRDYLATVAVDGKIYAIGGTLSYSNGFSTVEEYDPATDTWTRKADMPMRLWGLCANVVRGKIYTVGGRPGLQAVPRVQEYDPATDTWTQKSDMPIGTSQMDSVVLGDKIIVIGGWLWSMNFPYTTVQMYDPETDIWTIEADAPFLRATFSADVVNNRIYVIGGTDRPHPCPATSTVYVYDIIVDFNGDGIVDSADMCIMVDHWGEDYSLCDIGPTPFGDGIVDVQDLIVLAEHLFEEIYPIELVAYWKLDEEEGDIAYDSARDKAGLLFGGPVWRPAEGKRAGALEFDGIDDYVGTDFVLNPTDGAFSVFAWIKGGSPGQVIISQTDGIGGTGATWLGADSSGGNLMTGLVLPPGGRSVPQPLVSEFVAIDNKWHLIGFVWDGSIRALYVDGVEVAKDTQANLEGSDGGLHIGAGKNLEVWTFFSGLIDDVRIYNQALSAEKIEALAQ